MGLHLSTIGIIHTIIGIIALALAISALVKSGQIAPKSPLGKWYIYLTLAASFSSFAVMKTGHLSPSHFLTALILLILPVAIFARSITFFGRRAEAVQVVGMTATLYLSFIPTIVETLTRVPVGDPLAASQEAPVIKGLLGILTLVFTVLVFFQLRAVKRSRIGVIG